jgi:hypothetical protein
VYGEGGKGKDRLLVNLSTDGLGGLVVSMLASGSRVRGFKPGRSRWIFTSVKILSMPSFGAPTKQELGWASEEDLSLRSNVPLPGVKLRCLG